MPSLLQKCKHKYWNLHTHTQTLFFSSQALYLAILLSSSLCLSSVFMFHLPTCLRSPHFANITPSFYYLQSGMGFVTATGGWIQEKQILQSSMFLSCTCLLSPEDKGPLSWWSDGFMVQFLKAICSYKLENQRQDFRMAMGQRLSSLCYLITNYHGAVFL